MIVQTYQSQVVLQILKSGETYRAKQSIAFRGEYAALIDILELDCECPVFGVLKGRKQNTSGKVSASVRLTLDVPDEEIKLTEFSVWADFLYAFKFAKPGNYRLLQPDVEEFSWKRYYAILEDLKTQRKPSRYEFPQVVLDRIEPHWLKQEKVYHGKRSASNLWELFWNTFRK